MDDYTIKALDTTTWYAFADLAQRHNGVWGGCWCTWFHPAWPEKGQSPEASRAHKQHLVSEGEAHAALVFHAEAAVAWCEYGSPAELPGIYHLKQYTQHLVSLPDYRITCFFVGRGFRGKGLAAVALGGALDLIGEAGGGVVEGYPQDTEGRKVSGSFLYNGTRSMFAKAGFVYDRPKGKNHCVMRTTVAPR
jgi:hypothetical protein